MSLKREDGTPIKSSVPEINEFAGYLSTSRDVFLSKYRLLTTDSIMNSFKSDKMFQAAMWVLYLNL